MIELLESLRLNQGARWLRADLHIHTPASHDFKLKTLTPHEYVKAIQGAGIGLIGLADHSTAGWVDEMKRAARDLRRDGRIGVLPGVELSIGGVHLVLLFPETFGSNHIDHILSKLDIEPDDRGKPDTVCTTKTVVEVIQIVHEQGGIAVAAHCNSERTGLIKVLAGQARSQALELIDAVELKPGQSVPGLQSRLNDLIQREIPIIVSSDAHHPNELRADVSFLKMVRPTFRGAAQIRYEPKDRVAHSTPSSSTHPQIIGFQVDQGLFDGVPVRFSPHLNTLIGGRGTGKSAVLDILRFGLGVDARMRENQATLDSRIASFVGQGGRVQIFVKDGEGQLYCFVRVGDHTTGRQGGLPTITFTSQPQVHQLIGDRFIEVAKRPHDVLPIEFFGQGEVMELSRKAQDQLALLDEHVEFGTLRIDEHKTEQQLASNATQIVEFDDEMDRLEQSVLEAPTLEARLTLLKNELQNPIFSQRALWDKENTFLAWATTRMQALSAYAVVPLPISTTPPTLEASTPNVDLCTSLADILKVLSEFTAQKKDELQRAFTLAQTELSRISAEWQARNLSHYDAYREALRQAGGLELQALQRERAEKEERLRCIREDFEPQLASKRATIDQLLRERVGLDARLAEIRKGIHDARRNQLDALQVKLGSVRVEITENADRRAYLQHLKTLYHGSRIQSADAQLERIVEHLLPQEFAALLLRNDEAALVASAGVTAATANKLVTHPSREAKFEAGLVAVHDLPAISLRRSGEETYTSLDRLSDGERCSAVLSIALLEKNRPLLIDQPEDELDHQYVIDDIVANMKSIKKERQLIVATHDPNIPVLGDAELIMRVMKQPGVARCDFLAEGALEIEEVLTAVMGLEGGPEAFERRRRKYTMT